MAQFFFLFACIVSGILAQAGNSSCSLQPVEGDKTRYITCIPNKAEAFEIGDSFRIFEFKPNSKITGTNKWWSINLLSAEYKNLMHMAVRPGEDGKKGYILVTSNDGPWHTGKWGKQAIHNIDFPLDQHVEFKITNEDKEIKVEISGQAGNSPKKASFSFSHRTPNPEKDYKYLNFIQNHLDTLSELGRVEYRSHEDNKDQEISFSEEVAHGLGNLKILRPLL